MVEGHSRRKVLPHSGHKAEKGVPKTRYVLEKSLPLTRPSLLNAQSAMYCEDSQKEAAFRLGTFPIPLVRRLLYYLRLFLSLKC